MDTDSQPQIARRRRKRYDSATASLAILRGEMPLENDSSAQSKTDFQRVPQSARDILRMYAVAARAVSSNPALLARVSQRLDTACSGLVPPESTTARECCKLWHTFTKVANHARKRLRLAAGHALYRDLDGIGQRLELPPLVPWEFIPESIDELGKDASTKPAKRVSLREVRGEAKALFIGKPLKKKEPRQEVGPLLARLDDGERTQALNGLVGLGRLDRTEVSLVERHIKKGCKRVDPADTTLVETLGKLSEWLIEDSVAR